MNPVSVIIPAYNEAGRITNVLKALKDVPFIVEILVVDDGSKDNTVAVVREYASTDARVKLIQNGTNRGKGQAVFTGWKQSSCRYILMLDADLKGLTARHVNELCVPVLNGRADMTLGVFRGGQWSTDFSHWVTPWLSGQRCLRSELFECVSPEASQGYGIETALTVLARQMHLKVTTVPLMGMSHPPGEIHRGSIHGFLNRVKMYLQILRAFVVASGRKREIKLKQPGN